MTKLLKVPETSKLDFNGENEFLRFGGCHMQGWRPTMEDEAIHKLDISKDTHLFAVFDGHGSNEVSKFCKEHFTSVLMKQHEYDDGNFEEALSKACLELDKLINSPYGVKKLPQYQNGDSKSKQNELGGEEIAEKAGCCGCIALIHKNDVYCANIGDSRCVLARKAGNSSIKAHSMSHDQKPFHEEEKQRIEKAGGFVYHNRVEGSLAISRALGDYEYKQEQELPVDQQKVIAVPELQKSTIDSDTPFMILACDGIWECLTNQECTDLLWKQLQNNNGQKLSAIVGEMFDSIIAQPEQTSPGGHDNMTCIIVQFNV